VAGRCARRGGRAAARWAVPRAPAWFSRACAASASASGQPAASLTVVARTHRKLHCLRNGGMVLSARCRPHVGKTSACFRHPAERTVFLSVPSQCCRQDADNTFHCFFHQPASRGRSSTWATNSLAASAGRTRRRFLAQTLALKCSAPVFPTPLPTACSHSPRVSQQPVASRARRRSGCAGESGNTRSASGLWPTPPAATSLSAKSPRKRGSEAGATRR
jgi:hypothetical protein